MLQRNQLAPVASTATLSAPDRHSSPALVVGVAANSQAHHVPGPGGSAASAVGSRYHAARSASAPIFVGTTAAPFAPAPTPAPSAAPVPAPAPATAVNMIAACTNKSTATGGGDGGDGGGGGGGDAQSRAKDCHTRLGFVYSRNRYGQVTVTSQPSNESEFQLYRVLQHANLLSYYDTFISQGGDDVQQLCEAGEDEFLEIMALVGMASKPLHVRRLQKALQEWVNCPARFQLPILSLPGSGFLPVSGARGILPHSSMISLPMVLPSTSPQLNQSSSVAHHLTPPSTAPPEKVQQASPTLVQPTIAAPSYSPLSNSAHDRSASPSHIQEVHETWHSSSQQQKQSTIQRPPDSTDTSYPTSSSPLSLTPILLDSQIQRLADSAGVLAKALPSFEPKSNTSKKKMPKELEVVMSMPVNDTRRMELIRRYAAIYGRFDCKRKSEKPLTLHEVSVNEAAAQICSHVPALLTRRDELFPLARQVVRHSGYQYSKGHSRSQGAQCYSPRDFRCGDDSGGSGDAKRLRLDAGDVPAFAEEQWRARHERLERLAEELRQVRGRGEEMHQLLGRLQQVQDQAGAATVRGQLEVVEERERQLVVEQNSLLYPDKQFCKSLEFEDEDSRLSIGSASSAAENNGCDSCKDDDFSVETPEKPVYTLPKKRNTFSSIDDSMRSASKKLLLAPSIIADTSSSTAAAEPMVIASSAGNIIAVANPALSMSSLHTLHHCLSPSAPSNTTSTSTTSSGGSSSGGTAHTTVVVKCEPQPQEGATNLSVGVANCTGSSSPQHTAVSRRS